MIFIYRQGGLIGRIYSGGKPLYGHPVKRSGSTIEDRGMPRHHPEEKSLTGDSEGSQGAVWTTSGFLYSANIVLPGLMRIE